MDEELALIEKVLRNMGVDVDKKRPPHWITKYYHSNLGGKYKDGFICSRCGKHSWSKKNVCDGCNSIMQGM